MDTLLQCSAKSKQTGSRCKNFVVKGKAVCWIHGGKSKGPKTRKGLERIRIQKTKHGFYSQKAVDERTAFRALLKETDAALESIREQIIQL